MALPPISSANKAIALACVALFALQTVMPGVVERWLVQWPLVSGLFMPWQLITHGLVHVQLFSLVLTLLVLWLFASGLEQMWGTKRYLTFIVVCLLCGAVAHLALTTVLGRRDVPLMGLSAATLGLAVAFAMEFPEAKVMLLIPPMPVKAKYLVLVIALMEIVIGFAGWGGVAHVATLAGMLGGFLMIKYWRSRRRRW